MLQWPPSPKPVHGAPESNTAHLVIQVCGPRPAGSVFRLLRSSRPRAGFQAILVEVKSGSQSPDSAIYQLKCYRAALKRALPQPIVVWGIAEQKWRESAAAGGSFAASLPPADSYADRWVFSTADDISQTITALGLKPAATSEVPALAAAS